MSAPLTAPEADGEGRRERQVAQRVFAAEFNEAKLKLRDAGQYSPTFVVSPFGAKVNRLFLVGVLSRVEQSDQVAGSYRAQVVDPTGTFYLWAGQFEPEAATQISLLQTPCVVAVVGKAALRDTDAGATFVNVRPETIRVVEKADRDAWILDAAQHSMARLDALREAQKMEAPTAKALEDLGYARDVSEGVVKAIEHYGKADLAKYATLLRDALESLLPGAAERMGAVPDFAPAMAPAGKPAVVHATSAVPMHAAAPVAPKPVAPAKPADNPHEALVLTLCEKLDDGKGAPWEDIVGEASKKGVKETEVEECLNALMDKGQIYEPVLGRLKKT